jgi:hypothetical protein
MRNMKGMFQKSRKARNAPNKISSCVFVLYMQVLWLSKQNYENSTIIGCDFG